MRRCTRRGFLLGAGAIVVSTAVPLNALALKPTAADVRWVVESFDLGFMTGVACQVGGIRHAVHMLSRKRSKICTRQVAYMKESLLEWLRERGHIA